MSLLSPLLSGHDRKLTSRPSSQIRAARQVLEEDSDARKKRNSVVDLLKDSAHKIMSLETAKGGKAHFEVEFFSF